MNKDALSRFLAPQSVAVIGASSDPNRIGGRPIAYSLAAGYQGRIYPINPHHKEVQGLRAYPSLRDLKEPVDLVVVAVGKNLVEQAFADGEGMTSGYLVFTAGYKETTPEGVLAETHLRDLAAKQGSVLLGPNCLGYINVQTGGYLTFNSGLEGAHNLKSSPISIVTQSGAYGAYLFRLATERGLGLAHWVSTGNEAGLTTSDLIEYFAEDAATKVILAYVEGISDGAAFRRALSGVDAANKLLVLTKVGNTASGARAARSHTGSLVGSDEAFDAILRGHRAIRVNSIREMLDIAEAASLKTIPNGKRLGIVTLSGGAGIVMADTAEASGLSIPEMPESVQQHLVQRVPFATTHNPVDFTAQIINEPDLLEYSLLPIVREADIDAIAIFLSHVIAAPSLKTPLVEALRSVRRISDIPLYVAGITDAETHSTLRSLNIALCEDPVATIQVISRLVQAATNYAPAKNMSAERVPSTPTVIDKPQRLLEYDIKRWLAQNGIHVPEGRLVTSAEAASAAAAELGFPIVLKLQALNLLHKTEHKAVHLNLMSSDEVLRAAQQLLQLGQTLQLTNTYLLIEKQAPAGPEMILSIRRDPIFGPLLIYGLGGIMTEILHDVRTDPADVSVAEVVLGLKSLRGAPLLTGVRGQQAYRLEEIAETIVAIATLGRALLAQTDCIELEFNPLRITQQGTIVLDAVAYM